jgi:protein tyrosine/serine phosphatase
MQYFSFPMEVMTATPGSQACARDRLNSTQCNQRSLIGFIQAIRQYLYQNPNAKVYVHCARGQDRTGLAMGFFRVKVQGCSKENAREEMLSYRFNPTIPLQTIWDHIDQINP